LLLNFGLRPAIAAKPTTAKDAVVAATGEKSNKYIKIGTETMAPPAPIKPRTEPINTPLKAAIIIKLISITKYFHTNWFLEDKKPPLGRYSRVVEA
jgi:hypothetical protein